MCLSINKIQNHFAMIVLLNLFVCVTVYFSDNARGSAIFKKYGEKNKYLNLIKQ